VIGWLNKSLKRTAKLTYVLVAFWPGMSAGAIDQTGFPAKCRIYSSCNSGGCIWSSGQIAGNFILIPITPEILVSSSDANSEIRLVPSLKDASLHVGELNLTKTGHIMYYNREIADAFGINIHQLEMRGGELEISVEYQKYICSRISGGY